jgi:hypothetical protein
LGQSLRQAVCLGVILKAKLIADESRFLLYSHLNHQVVLLFKDSSEAASPNRRCSQCDLEILKSSPL